MGNVLSREEYDKLTQAVGLLAGQSRHLSPRAPGFGEVPPNDLAAVSGPGAGDGAAAGESDRDPTFASPTHLGTNTSPCFAEELAAYKRTESSSPAPAALLYTVEEERRAAGPGGDRSPRLVRARAPARETAAGDHPSPRKFGDDHLSGGRGSRHAATIRNVLLGTS